VALLVPGEGGAYRIGGAPWPGGRIAYYNAATDQAWAVHQAVTAWNSSGARVRFYPTTRANAQLVIRPFPTSACLSHAQATVGYVRRAVVYVSRRNVRHATCTPFTAAAAIVHELGHVLGLVHETRTCAAMNPTGSFRGPGRCKPTKPWEWRCRLLAYDDVRGAVRLYGGTVRPYRGPTACPVYEPVSPPAEVTAEIDEASGALRLAFVRPAPPAIPPFLLSLRRTEEGFAVRRKRDSCPLTPDLHATPRYRWDAPAGGEEDFLTPLPPPGRYCIAVWPVDQFIRPSARPATAWVDVP
jgi:hypothetical protein